MEKKSKRGFAPVVALMFLLLVLVGAIGVFYGWSLDFLSGETSETEEEGDLVFELLKPENVIGGYLHVRNPTDINVTIKQIKIGGIECGSNFTSTPGVSKLNVFRCMFQIDTGKNEVLLVSNERVISESKNLKKVDLDCSILDGGEWVKVPGNSDLGTIDFCVMKYEAKATTSSLSYLDSSANMHCGTGADGAGNGCDTDNVNITSSYEYAPLSRVTWNDSSALCQKFGDGYDLITAREWTTIARIIENNPLNWNSSVVGTGYIFSGNDDDGIDGTTSGGKLNASFNDSDGYYRTGDSSSSSSCDTERRGYSAAQLNTMACIGQKRTLYVENQIIWDFSGNVQEINRDLVHNNDSILGRSSGDYNMDWDSITGYDYYKLGNYFDRNEGVGQAWPDDNSSIEPSPIGDNPYHSISRGGDYGQTYYGRRGGISSAAFPSGPSVSELGLGFRCSYGYNS